MDHFQARFCSIICKPRLTYLISDAERILPSNISLAALATALPGPMDATARTLSPLEQKV